MHVYLPVELIIWELKYLELLWENTTLFCNPGPLRVGVYMVWNFAYGILSWSSSHREVTPNHLAVILTGYSINIDIWPMKTFPQLGTAAADLDNHNNAPGVHPRNEGGNGGNWERNVFSKIPHISPPAAHGICPQQTHMVACETFNRVDKMKLEVVGQRSENPKGTLPGDWPIAITDPGLKHARDWRRL